MSIYSISSLADILLLVLLLFNYILFNYYLTINRIQVRLSTHD